MTKPKVLFICVHNSARSQMAEAFLNKLCEGYFEAQSAGLEPGTLNPLVVEAMAEVGVDISKKKTQAVFDAFRSGDSLPMSSRFAVRPRQRNAQFFRDLPSDCIGLSRILLRLRARGRKH